MTTAPLTCAWLCSLAVLAFPGTLGASAAIGPALVLLPWLWLAGTPRRGAGGGLARTLALLLPLLGVALGRAGAPDTAPWAEAALALLVVGAWSLAALRAQRIGGRAARAVHALWALLIPLASLLAVALLWAPRTGSGTGVGWGAHLASLSPPVWGLAWARGEAGASEGVLLLVPPLLALVLFALVADRTEEEAA